MIPPNIAELSLHPIWENRQFSKQEYALIVERLANKDATSAIMVENHSLKLAGMPMRIWQAIKEFLGLGSGTDLVIVNFELMKLMRYGINHHYLEDSAINTLIARLLTTLNREPQHQRIANIMNKTLIQAPSIPKQMDILDNEIKAFVKDNRSRFDEAFWPKLFHRLIKPVIVDYSILQYNQGRILASNGNFKESIQCLESALQSSNVAFKEELLKVRIDVLTSLAALEMRKKNCQGVIDILNNPRYINDFHNILKELDHRFTKEESGRLYLFMAISDGFKNNSLEFLRKGINNLSIAASEAPSKELYQDLIKARLLLSGKELTAGHLKAAEQEIRMVTKELEISGLFQNQELSTVLIKATQAVADRQMENLDYFEAFETWTNLDILGPDFIKTNPVIQAKQLHALAKIKQEEGKLSEALIFIKEAEKVHSEERHLLFIKNLENVLFTIAMRQFDEAQIESDRNNFDKALAGFQNLANRYPENTAYKSAIITTHVNAGNFYLGTKDAEKAIAHYNKALELSNNQFGPYVDKLIEAHTLLNSPIKNVANYERLAKLFPAHGLRKISPNDYVHAITTLLEQDNYDTAFKLSSSAYLQFTNDAIVKKLHSAAVYKRKMNLDPPETDKQLYDVCNYVLDISPNAPAECHFKLAQLYAKAIATSEDLFKTGKRLQEPEKGVYKSRAMECMINAAKADPDNFAYQFECGKYLLHYSDLTQRKNDYDPLPYLKRSFEHDPENIDYIYGYNQALYQHLGQTAANEDLTYKTLSLKLREWQEKSTNNRTDYETLISRWNAIVP